MSLASQVSLLATAVGTAIKASRSRLNMIETGSTATAGAAPDGTWQNLAITSLYTAAAAPDVPQIMRFNGIVYLKGRIVKNTAADGAAAFTLPAGYRPISSYLIVCDCIPIAAFARMQIATTGVGTFLLKSGVPTTFSLYGSFPVF